MSAKVKVQIQFRRTAKGRWRRTRGVFWQVESVKRAKWLIDLATQYPARGWAKTEYRIIKGKA